MLIIEKDKSTKRKRKKDPRDEYYVVDTYDENGERTLEEILASKEYLEVIYKLMIKYGSLDDDDKKKLSNNRKINEK